MVKSPLAVYIHWPFCLEKCPYCDFNSHRATSVDITAWQQAYQQEIRYFSSVLKQSSISSIFFGGGTPSLMPPQLVEYLLSLLASITCFSDDIEITLEANPTSVEKNKLHGFREAGINRVSLGIQALNEKDLHFLGRQHSVKEALAALTCAQHIFANYSFDLIYARPGQTLLSWQKELQQALSLCGGHISLYELTIEKGTPFYRQYQNKEFTLPSENRVADLYALTHALTQQAGLLRYEISNYARNGCQARHNLTYWRYQDYLGLGPGAHSRITLENGQKQAFMMQHEPKKWLSSISGNSHAIQQQSCLTPQECLTEIIVMGLRITEGIKRQTFINIMGKDIEECFQRTILQECCAENLLIIDNNAMRVSEKAFPLTQAIALKLLKNIL